MLDRFQFVVGEALQALRRNSLMTFATVTTAATALFLLGVLILSGVKLRSYSEGLANKLEIRVFVKDGVEDKDLTAIKEGLTKIPGVAQAIWISKKEGWAAFKKAHPGLMTEGIDDPIPIPDLFRVRLTEYKAAKPVADAAQKLDNVAEVRYRTDVEDFLEKSVHNLNLMGLVWGSILLMSSGILIYNTIRLTITSRSREIRIMRLVGATRMTIMLPMMLEGILQGVLGGVVAALMMRVSARIFSFYMGEEVGAKLTDFPLGLWMFNLAVLGAGFGFVCSLLGLRDMRRER